jgi:BA14K-like protein
MPYLIKSPIDFAQFRKSFASCTAAALLSVAVGTVSVLSSTHDVRADGFYFGTGGVGIAFGTGGYRGGYFGGYRGGYRGGIFYGFSGPPYRPYGAPHYYHPYDMRAYPYRSRVYVNPRRYVGQPQRVPHTKTGLPPFTRQWVAYCSRKFKSFNPNTGTYLAYSGKYRFCR